MSSAVKRVPIPGNGVDYRGKIVLAPMVRSGELPSRLLALHYGADLVWGPETVDHALIGTTRRFNASTSTVDFTRLPSNGSKVPNPHQKESLIYRLHPAREGRRLVFQLGTSSPERAVQAARLVAGDVAGIDVNAGCPKPFSTSGGMGAALLTTPDLLCGILEALVHSIGREFDIGISVKIRLLETSELTERLVRRLCDTGIVGLTVHCRTTLMRPRERALRHQLRMITSVCKEKGVACVMNGDVANSDEARELMREFGADGAMIATRAEANPSCFRSKVDGGLAPWREVVGEYIKIALEVENRWGNTKFLLNQLIPGKDATYRIIASSKNYQEVCRILGLEYLQGQAKDVDEVLGIQRSGNMTIEKAKASNPTARAAGGRMRTVKPSTREDYDSMPNMPIEVTSGATMSI
ncbi:MAG: hypothetical protein M1827_004662 [Pycnora praestabilis]|nr:MAG: hypothetical protein M1827_004662 [Pycnora praestabilis]